MYVCLLNNTYIHVYECTYESCLNKSRVFTSVPTTSAAVPSKKKEKKGKSKDMKVSQQHSTAFYIVHIHEQATL